MEMKTIKREGEAEIVVFVLIPQCKACRDRIEQTILGMGCFERVEVGYPRREGSPVSLVYIEGKYPEVDYWEKALQVKDRLDAMGYRVL